VPLIKGVEAPLVLVTNPKVPAKTFPELITWLKANAGKLSFASYSAGTPSHFLGDQLNEKFKLDLVHVPYTGAGPQVNDLFAGHSMLGFTQIATALPHVEAGKLNAIATTGPARFRSLPSTPTLAELGHPDLVATIWFGLFVRASTPAEMRSRLTEAARAALMDPDIRKKLEDQGFDVSGESGESTAAGIRAGTERWSKIVQATGFKRD
jgi:tripartite-type tricarboxylate transporter receptor subunit TctC